MSTARLGLPEMVDDGTPGNVPFNELVRTLDATVGIVVESRTATDPPGSPVEGELWWVPAGGTGAWVGEDNSLAQWLGGQWYFYDLPSGTPLFVVDEDRLFYVIGAAFTEISYPIAAYRDLVVLAAPIVHLTFDDDIYGTAHDFSGNGHDGTMRGNAGALYVDQPPLVDGGRGVFLTGDNGRIELSQGVFTGPYCLELLVRLRELTSESAICIQNTDRWGLWKNADRFEWRSSAGTLVGSTVLRSDQPYHIVVNVNVGGNVTFYISNTVAATGSGDTSWRPQTVGTTELPSLPLHGLIDQVAIYDRELTAQEIADHYNAR